MELPSSRKLLNLLSAAEGEDPTSDPEKMGEIIKDFWQEVWDDRQGKPTPDMLNNYFNSYNKRIDPSLSPAMPTKRLVRQTIRNTNNSCAGPDGIPFAIYRNLIDISSDVIFDMLVDLGLGVLPPPGFNYARLFIIPKSSSTLISKTRHIAFSNSDNRIIAKCVTYAITPCLQDFLDDANQGFVKLRSQR